MPSVDEEGRNRSYAFKNIDEIVLTIEEHFQLLPCKFRLLSDLFPAKRNAS